MSLILGLWLVGLDLAPAEEPRLSDRGGKEIYPHNFARDLRINQPSGRSRIGPLEDDGWSVKKENKKTAAEVVAAKDVAGETLKSDGEKTAETAANTDPFAAAGEAVEVRSIGVIINSLDRAHYDEKIKELIDLAVEHDLGVGHIYSIGDMAAASENPDFMPLMARGAVIQLASRPPKKYQVTLSPSWILETEKGEIVLEGTGPLHKHFDNRGRFIDRYSGSES